MRRHGAVTSADGLDPFPHLAVTYHDRSQFWARAAEYIVDAVRRNQRVEYAGDGSQAALRAELAAVPGAEDVLASGQLSATPVRDFYPFRSGSDVVDADVAVTRYLSATEQAVGDGYAGYRAVVDATVVARTPEQRAAFARCEYLVDQQMAADLEFIGHEQLLVLDRYARAADRDVALYTQQPIPLRVAGLLDLTNVRVEAPGEMSAAAS